MGSNAFWAFTVGSGFDIHWADRSQLAILILLATQGGDPGAHLRRNGVRPENLIIYPSITLFIQAQANPRSVRLDATHEKEGKALNKVEKKCRPGFFDLFRA